VADQLKARRRNAFVLREQGYVFREIGDRLGVSESTAQNDVHWIEAELMRLSKLRPIWPEHDGP
jgi:DNA-directed RNA polymerase specialized sigma24 family protein